MENGAIYRRNRQDLLQVSEQFEEKIEEERDNQIAHKRKETDIVELGGNMGNTERSTDNTDHNVVVTTPVNITPPRRSGRNTKPVNRLDL